MTASCVVPMENTKSQKAPFHVFNYNKYAQLGNDEHSSIRKKKSLIVKNRSASSLSVNSSSSKDRKIRHVKTNSSAKLQYNVGLASPSINQSKANFFHVTNKPKVVQGSGKHGSNASSFFMGGFLTRPKEKSGLSKLEKEVNNAINSLQHIRAEVESIKKAGTHIGVQEARKGDKKVTKVTLSGGTIFKTASRQVSPDKSKVHTDGRNMSAEKKKKQLTMNKSCNNLFAKTEASSFTQNVKTQGIVKSLLGQLLPNTATQKTQSYALDEFVQSLLPQKSKQLGSHNHNSSMGDFPTETSMRSLHNKYTELVSSLVEVTAEARLQSGKKPVPKVNTSTQTAKDAEDRSTIGFSNINLSKTIEELIKKVIIESKAVKYNPNTLTDYFETLAISDRQSNRKISDMQKQALFVSIYSLLQRQMLVEVTLEMIKDSGVNVQNLFQYTFSRIGLDYEKYVHYENHRDQDLSARTVFDGELECTLEEEASERDMVLSGYGNLGKFNYFPLDFNKIQQNQTNDNQTEVHTENSQSTKR